MSNTILGKRKSRLQKADPSVSQEDAKALLAKHFEAHFMPLAPTTAADTGAQFDDGDDDNDKDEYDEDNGDSWGGFSGDEDASSSDAESSPPPNVVEVISHQTETYATNPLQDKRESKSWLSSRPPIAYSSSASTATSKGSKKTTAEEDAPSLLKNDLALQRLLSESHLFSSAAAKGNNSTDRSNGSETTDHVGRNRHLATDLRLAALGSKTSIYRQAKMPMSFRKGIKTAAVGKETKRRREAKENGIVLERPSAALLGKKPVGRDRRRGGDIDAPAVGRMNNGMLKLSKRDIASIEGGGPRKGGVAKKKRRR
ncbi:hypothetical protein F5Y16DRAFT_16819 [Xylariaceae sp. FL0255]|nr:hypothetical protein F5Y16DRAFT_16819 [Xylariaceae sp. FL0255]